MAEHQTTLTENPLNFQMRFPWAHPQVLQSPEPQVLFRHFGDSALDFELYVWVADLDTRAHVASDLHQDIARRFRQAGIEIPFPQRDLHVRSVEEPNNLAAIVRA